MRRVRVTAGTAAVVTMAMAGAMATPAPAPAFGQAARFTVADSIQMTTFSLPSTNEPSGRGLLSPDGSGVLVVTSRGVMATDKVESTLWLYRVGTVRRYLASPAAVAPEPQVLARVASSSNLPKIAAYAPVISAVRWAPDSRSVYYLAESSDAHRRLCRNSLTEARAAECLTPPDVDVTSFDVAADTLVYLGVDTTADTKPAGEEINPDARDITGNSLAAVLFPEQALGMANTLRSPTLGLLRPAGAESIAKPRTTLPAVSPVIQTLSLDPTGRSLIEAFPVASVPASWSAYRPSTPAMQTSHSVAPAQYVRVDLDSGKVALLVDAPLSWSFGYPPAHTKATWSRDGRRVLITGTFLPLDGVDAEERARRSYPCDAAVMEMSSGIVTCLTYSTYRRDSDGSAASRRILLDATFSDDAGNSVVLRFADALTAGNIQYWQFASGRWQLQGAAVASADIALSLVQGVGQPAGLWVVDELTGRRKLLWDPNPQLAALERGEASVYHWKDKTGYEWTGGLVKPVDYVPGRRYPLVIQTYVFDSQRFLADGMDTTAEAALPLASAGIAVLQVHKRFDNSLTDRESAEQLPGFEAAIDQLVSDGLVDPARVGIIGFSRGCYYVESALIQMPQRFVAATLADGVDQSYMQYRMFDIAEGQAIYGVRPNGAGLMTWVRSAPSFNLDKVLAPTRIEAIGPVSVLSEWEIYSSLRSQGKPVDLVYIPNGQHILQKPLERLASQQGNVDWFRFWLQGLEDPSPAKAGQYRRWEALRGMAGGTPLRQR